MVFSITYIQIMSAFPVDVAYALRMMELCLVVGTIDETNFTVTNNVIAFQRFFIHNYNSVISWVWDNQHIVWHAFLTLNSQNFAWVPQVLRLCGRQSWGLRRPILIISISVRQMLLHMSLLLLRSQLESCLMVEWIVIKIISNRYKQIKNLPVPFTRQNQDRNLGTRGE